MFWAAERAAYDPETLSIAHHYVGASRSCRSHTKTAPKSGWDPGGSAPGSEGPGGLLT